MSLEIILVYIHVVGAIGYFAGTVMSVFGLVAMRRAERVEQIRPILDLITLSDPVSAISLIVTIIVGLYVTATTWGWQTAWIDVSLGSLILLMPVGAVMGTQRRAIAKLAKESPDGPLSEALKQRIYGPILSTALLTLLTLLFGILFLMIVKPAVEASVITVVVAVVLGFVLSFLLQSNSRSVAGKSNA